MRPADAAALASCVGGPLVVVTHRMHAEVAEALQHRARVVANETDETWPRAELLRRVVGADAIVAFMPDRIDEELLAACPSLRIVAGAFKGGDNVDFAACARRGVRVSVVEDLLSAPTAELAVALLLALGRNVLTGDRVVRSGGFSGWRPTLYGRGLDGSAVGIVGFGGVGRAVAVRVAPFGARIRFHDPSAPDGEPGATPLDELIATSDFVVLAAPLTPATHHLFDAARIARMRRGACLVNVGRGSVVDEDAVAAALETGHLAGYAADVFEMEDLSRADRPATVHPALRAPAARTVLTPHLGSAVADVRLEIEWAAARAVLRALEADSAAGGAASKSVPCGEVRAGETDADLRMAE